MTNKLSVIFSTLAGICFVGGLTILTKYGEITMERLERILSILDYTLSNKKKRHIAGGILLSVPYCSGISIYGHDIKT